MQTVLPNVDNAVIPLEKFTGYCLNFQRDPNKAIAFMLSLGYTRREATTLASDIKQNISRYNAVYKGNKGYGDLYEVIIVLSGKNGKEANVLTCWIIENGTDFPRLTNAYVTKKKVVR